MDRRDQDEENMANLDAENGATGESREPAPPEDINPWRDIFVRPRATARWLIARETAANAQTLWLSFTAFFIVMLFLMLTFYPGKFDRAWSKMQLVMLTPVVFLISWGYFIAESYLLWLFTRLLGGRSEVRVMRIINAYTTVIPSVVFGLLSLGLSFLVNRDSLVTKIFENVTMVWTMWISLASLSIAAGVSAWRAVTAYLASLIIWIGGVAVAIGLLKIYLPQLLGNF